MAFKEFSPIPLSRLIGVLGNPPLTADPLITGIALDSRKVQPGNIFVALSGGSTDGHHYIPDALQRGAAAVVGAQPLEGLSVPYLRVEDARRALAYLAAAFYDFPAHRLTVIGVTGTDGKTTTCNLIYYILQAAGIRAGMISTVNAVIGDQALDTGFHVTTPEAPDVQRYLAMMVEAGLTHVVLEVTSHGLDQQRVGACEFDVAVVTNITHEHLDYHGDYESYRAAKARLFRELAQTPPKPQGNYRVAVLNRDDGSYEYLWAINAHSQAVFEIPPDFDREQEYSADHRSAIRNPQSKIQNLKSKIVSYGLHPSADPRAADIAHTPHGLRFTALARPSPSSGLPAIQSSIQTHLVGLFNVHNCLAAIAATVNGLGLDISAAQKGIAALEGIAGRMESVDMGQDFLAIVDFAHTPNALRRALEAVREISTAENVERPHPGPPHRGNSDGEGRPPPSPPPSVALRWGRQGGGRIISVFGSAGLRDRQKRRLMAEVSAELADFTIFTAEDPRSESLDGILSEMAAGAEAHGGIEGQTFWRIRDRGEALRFALSLAHPGDAVLACGKGHEQSMCFGEIEYAWDDRIALRASLAERLGVPGPAMPYLPTQGIVKLDL